MAARHGLSEGDAVGPSGPRREKLGRIRHEPGEVAERVAIIHDRALRESPYLKAGNFAEIHAHDLDLLFDLYDEGFFEGLLKGMLRADGAYPVRMRLSRRLTRSAGQTVQRVHRGNRPEGSPAVHYEIAVSTTLLFSTFLTPGRVVESSGLVCRDRLEALQRTFEHELLHLAEFLAWGRSNCSEPNFRTLSERIFAHEGVHHDLVTPRERAEVEFDIRVGDAVAFEFDGRPLAGIVNRITRRVTVLVPDPRGEPFSDGRRYLRYYVPMEKLRKRSMP